MTRMAADEGETIGNPFLLIRAVAIGVISGEMDFQVHRASQSS